MKYLFPLVFLFLSFDLFSQTQLNPVKWEITYEVSNEKEGFIVLKATIEDKWHIYSQNQSGEGPIPSSFLFKDSKNYSKISSTQEPIAEKIFSEVFGIDVVSFSKEAVFKQKISLKKKKSFEIIGELEFMACNDNSCLPPKKIPFKLHVPALSDNNTK